MFRKLELREPRGVWGAPGCDMGYPRNLFFRSELILTDQREISRSLGLFTLACFQRVIINQNSRAWAGKMSLRKGLLDKHEDLCSDPQLIGYFYVVVIKHSVKKTLKRRGSQFMVLENWVHHSSKQQAGQQELNAESSWPSWIARTKQKEKLKLAWAFTLSNPVSCSMLPPKAPPKSATNQRTKCRNAQDYGHISHSNHHTQQLWKS